MSNHFREMALRAKAAYDEKVATKRRKKEADADAKAKGILAQVEVLRHCRTKQPQSPRGGAFQGLARQSRQG